MTILRRIPGPLRFLALGAAGAAVLVVVGLALVSRTETRTRDRWEEAVGGGEALAARYPDRPTSQSARRLETLAAELSVDLRPMTGSGVGSPADRERGFGAVSGPVQGWVYRSLESPEPGFEPPPAAFLAFRAAHRETLDAMVHLLRSEATPRWERRLLDDAGSGRHQLGHFTMQILLAGEALALAHDGAGDRAVAALDAAFRLNGSLRDEPDLMAQILSIAGARLHAGLLRRLEVDPASWRSQLAEHDHRGSFLEAVEVMGWLSLNADVDPSLLPDLGAARRLWSWIRGPYDRLCWADAMDRWLRDVDRIANETSGCPDGFRAEDLTGPPWWNTHPDITMPNVLYSWERVARLRLAMELTDVGLAWREGAAGSLAELPRSIPSTVCPGDTWILDRDGDHVVVRFSRELAEHRDPGLVLPMELRIP